MKTQSPGVLLINQLALEDVGYYQCIADNGLGVACATAKLTVIVREGLPSPPRQLSAVPYSSTTVLLTWEKPEFNSDQIIGYSVHCQGAAGWFDPDQKKQDSLTFENNCDFSFYSFFCWSFQN